jgi:DNA polymerase delta subunit 2
LSHSLIRFIVGDEWIGLVSGLEVGTMMPIDAQLQMLTEYLTGEEGGEDDQLSAAKISRLIIAGNSLATGALAERIETPSYAERKAVRRLVI